MGLLSIRPISYKNKTSVCLTLTLYPVMPHNLNFTYSARFGVTGPVLLTVFLEGKSALRLSASACGWESCARGACPGEPSPGECWSPERAHHRPAVSPPLPVKWGVPTENALSSSARSVPSEFCRFCCGSSWGERRGDLPIFTVLSWRAGPSTWRG